MDLGVSPTEGLALITDQNKHRFAEYLLRQQPIGTTGFARDLNPNKFYLACRWDYTVTPKSALAEIPSLKVSKSSKWTGRLLLSRVDWGPHPKTGRAADLSPGLAKHLDLKTGDIVEVKYN